MEQRKAVRYSSSLLPDCMGTATIRWDGDAQLETAMANCSAHGVRVIIPAAQVSPDNPAKDDTILVRMLTSERWFTGMCVYASTEEDGSVSLGIHFLNPYEQNYIQHLIYKALHNQSAAHPR